MIDYTVGEPVFALNETPKKSEYTECKALPKAEIVEVNTEDEE